MVGASEPQAEASTSLKGVLVLSHPFVERAWLLISTISAIEWNEACT